MYRSLLFILLVLGMASPATATSFTDAPRTVSEMVEQSTALYRARVEAMETKELKGEGGRLLYSVVQLRVLTSYRGPADGELTTIYLMGGRLDNGRGNRWGAVLGLHVGDEVLIAYNPDKYPMHTTVAGHLSGLRFVEEDGKSLVLNWSWRPVIDMDDTLKSVASDMRCVPSLLSRTTCSWEGSQENPADVAMEVSRLDLLLSGLEADNPSAAPYAEWDENQFVDAIDHLVGGGE